MSLNTEAEGLAPLLAKLSPYLRRQLELAADKALWMHADEVALEHFVWAISLDDDSAIFVTVDQAFADTDTVSADLLSLCSGILVTTRSGALPFSTRGVLSMRAARELARDRGLAEVGGDCLLLCSTQELEVSLVQDLQQAGLDLQPVRAGLAEGDASLSTEGHLFKHFSNAARQQLVVSARQAAAAEETSVGPARIVAATLAGDDRLAELCGLSGRRAKLCIEGRALDDTPPPARVLALDAALASFLGELPERASSLTLVSRLLDSPESELAQVFARQKITQDLLVRAESAYDDPSE